MPLFLHLIPEIAVLLAFHDRLRAGQLHVFGIAQTEGGIAVAGPETAGDVREPLPCNAADQPAHRRVSRPLDPHPLFVEFVRVCLSERKKKQKNKK